MLPCTISGVSETINRLEIQGWYDEERVSRLSCSFKLFFDCHLDHGRRKSNLRPLIRREKARASMVAFSARVKAHT